MVDAGKAVVVGGVAGALVQYNARGSRCVYSVLGIGLVGSCVLVIGNGLRCVLVREGTSPGRLYGRALPGRDRIPCAT